MSKNIVVSIFIVVLVAVVWVVFVQKDSPSEQTEIESKDSVSQEADVHVEHIEEKSKDSTGHAEGVHEKDLADFDFKDPTTWGEPTGFDEDGNPTGYRRVLPNGNVRTAMPFHGMPNTTINPHQHPVHHDLNPPEKDKYQHWHKGSVANPLVVASCVDSQWEKSVNKSISLWNQTTFIHMTLQPYPGQVTDGVYCFENEIPGMITITNFDFEVVWPGQGMREYAGYAFGDHDINGHMLWGLVTLNDRKEWFDTQVNTPDVVDAWRDMTVCHELGHTLGIGHNDMRRATATGSCMNYTVDPFSNLEPGPHDFEQIEVSYGHTHERMGMSCRLGEPMGPLAGSTALYGVVAAEDFFKTPYAPEKKTTGDWVVVQRWDTPLAEMGTIVHVEQSPGGSLFDEQQYYIRDETSEYGFGVIDPGPNHTYFDAFASELEAQQVLSETIGQQQSSGLLKDCTDWKVNLPDLLWDTSLEYVLMNSPERAAKEQEMKEAKRKK